MLMQVVFHADIESDAGPLHHGRRVRRRGAKSCCSATPMCSADGHADIAGVRCWSDWEQLKRREKGQNTVADSYGQPWPARLPALWRAEKLQKKAAAAGFDVAGRTGRAGQAGGGSGRAAPRRGEWRRCAGGAGRRTVRRREGAAASGGCDPEDALNGACEKFIHRFRAVEEGAAVRGREVSQLSLEEMTALWDEAKRSQCDLDRFEIHRPPGQCQQMTTFWEETIMNKTELIAAVAEKTGSVQEGHRGRRQRYPADHHRGPEGRARRCSWWALAPLRSRSAPPASAATPSTKETMEIPASKVPAFKAGKALKDAVAE